MHVELAELYVQRFRLCCPCDVIVVVAQVSQCTVQHTQVATAYCSSAFFGGCGHVTEWNTETGVVTKVAEHTGEFPSFRPTPWVAVTRGDVALF